MKRALRLVDYDSASGSESEPGSPSQKPRASPSVIHPQLKRRQTGAGDIGAKAPHSAPVPAPARAAPHNGNSGTRITPPTLAPKPTSSLPPLSDRFNDINPSNPRTAVTDDPSLHQGRQRQVPHIPGNWPSHVYIDWDPSPGDRELLTYLIDKLKAEVQSAAQRFPDLEGVAVHTALKESDVSVDRPLHISLSAPITLTSNNKDEFLDDLTKAIKSCRVSPFVLDFSGGVDWYRAEDSTRSFLVLRVREVQDTGNTSDSSPNPQLTTLLDKCNETVKNYRQPPLYDSRDVGNCFHVTIAWTLARPSESLRQLTDSVFNDSKTTLNNKVSIRDKLRTGSRLRVDTVKVKIGNYVTRFELDDRGISRPVKTA